MAAVQGQPVRNKRFKARVGLRFGAVAALVVLPGILGACTNGFLAEKDATDTEIPVVKSPGDPVPKPAPIARTVQPKPKDPQRIAAERNVPEPEPKPGLSVFDQSALVGASKAELIALVGPPERIEENAASERWLYASGACRMTVQLFKDLESGAFRALKSDISGGEANRCLARLRRLNVAPVGADDIDDTVAPQGAAEAQIIEGDVSSPSDAGPAEFDGVNDADPQAPSDLAAPAPTIVDPASLDPASLDPNSLDLNKSGVDPADVLNGAVSDGSDALEGAGELATPGVAPSGAAVGGTQAEDALMPNPDQIPVPQSQTTPLDAPPATGSDDSLAQPLTPNSVAPDIDAIGSATPDLVLPDASAIEPIVPDPDGTSDGTGMTDMLPGLLPDASPGASSVATGDAPIDVDNSAGA